MRCCRCSSPEPKFSTFIIHIGTSQFGQMGCSGSGGPKIFSSTLDTTLPRRSSALASKLSLLTLSVHVKRHILQSGFRKFRVREYERKRRLCTGNNGFLSSFPGLGCSFSIPVRRRSAGKAQVGSSKAASRTSTLFCRGKAASRNLVQNFNCAVWV